MCASDRPFKIFGLHGSHAYAQAVAESLGMGLTPVIEKAFGDGELYVSPVPGSIGNVRGHNVFVIQSLYSDDFVATRQRLDQLLQELYDLQQGHVKIGTGPLDFFASRSGETVSDKFMKLCIMCGALRDASANEIIAIIPHLAWARQDRKTQSRAPITTKYVARMLEAVGVDRVVMIDVHNLAAEQNAFRVPIDNLETKNLHARWCAERLKQLKAQKVRVLSPDSGGLARATRFRNALAAILKEDHEDNIEICIFDKIREKGRVKGGRIIGDVQGAQVIAYDDMISTGGTMKKACHAVLAAGGELLAICTAHGLFCENANEVFQELETTLLVSDTIPPFRLNELNRRKVVTISTTKMVGEAITRIHSGTGSISELLDLDVLLHDPDWITLEDL